MRSSRTLGRVGLWAVPVLGFLIFFGLMFVTAAFVEGWLVPFVCFMIGLAIFALNVPGRTVVPDEPEPPSALVDPGREPGLARLVAEAAYAARGEQPKGIAVDDGGDVSMRSVGGSDALVIGWGALSLLDRVELTALIARELSLDGAVERSWRRELAYLEARPRKRGPLSRWKLRLNRRASGLAAAEGPATKAGERPGGATTLASALKTRDLALDRAREVQWTAQLPLSLGLLPPAAEAWQGIVFGTETSTRPLDWEPAISLLRDPAALEAELSIPALQPVMWEEAARAGGAKHLSDSLIEIALQSGDYSPGGILRAIEPGATPLDPWEFGVLARSALNLPVLGMDWTAIDDNYLAFDDPDGLSPVLERAADGDVHAFLDFVRTNGGDLDRLPDVPPHDRYVGSRLGLAFAGRPMDLHLFGDGALLLAADPDIAPVERARRAARGPAVKTDPDGRWIAAEDIRAVDLYLHTSATLTTSGGTLTLDGGEHPVTMPEFADHEWAVTLFRRGVRAEGLDDLI